MSVLLVVAAAVCAMAAPAAALDESTLSTLASLQSNVLSYLLVVVPAAFFVRYIKQHPEKAAGPGVLMASLRMCIFGMESTGDGGEPGDGTEPDLEAGKGGKSGKGKGDSDAEGGTMMQQALKLAFCVAGLQGSYLTWGVLQEQIMTQSYGQAPDGSEIRFTNSQYLVFVNRVLALCAAAVVIRVTRQPRHGAPLYRYSFASMSNIMSSWCQYEALRYVSFPTQVLAKSSKIIPVMIMGKFVQNKTYPAYEYVCALVLSMGVSLFMFSKAEEEGKVPTDEKETSLMGVFLLVGYMAFDSFTSNFQAHLFKTYKMSSYQMMFGVNLFSCFFTMWSLIQAGVFMDCFAFTLTYPAFMVHCIVLSITSATGQMFIFYTLNTYGALVFAIIMTTRQVISIFVSALIFGHTFAALGWVGIAIASGSMFARIYLKQQSSKK